MENHMDFSDVSHVRWTLLQMVLSLVGYVWFYKALRQKFIKNPTAPELCCRSVTFVHGIISCACAIYYVVLPALGYYKVASIPSTLILTHSMGYFTFDLFWCFVHGETPVMKFHHILTVTGLFYYSFKISKQFFIVYALGLTEITNPLLQVRWFLKHHGKRNTIAFKIIEILFLFCFFVIRLGVLSYYLYEAWFNKSLKFNGDDLTFTTLGALTGYALAFQMYNYIRYQLKKSKKKKELNELKKE